MLASAALVVADAGTVNAVQTAQSVVVSDNPSNTTPDVLNGKVEAIVQVGNTVIIGGTFTQIAPSGTTPGLTRNNIAAFDATTGAISTTFAPTVDGEVTSLVASADQQSVYVGGFFNTVNGATRRKVARLNVADGQNTAGFTPAALDGAVKDLKLAGNRLWVGGLFTKIGSTNQPILGTLNASTGARAPYMALTFAGPRNNGALQIMKFDISPDGRRLVAIGNFTTINGLDRGFMGILDISGSTNAAVSDWQTNFFGPGCAGVFDTYMRDLDISPDGAYVAVSTTGAYGGANSPCDSITRWELSATGSGLSPSWLTTTGGDTTYAVAVTGSAVYVGGHFRWQNNSFAGDYAGPGAIAREGIAALDPTNGLPFSWNPGRERGVGVFDMLATSQGLWIGHDTERVAEEPRKRLAFFPLAGGTAIPANATGSVPGHVFLAGATAQNSPVLYRVNAAGSVLLATDGGPDWSGDNGGDNPLRNSGSNGAGWSPVGSVAGTVPASTPSAVFESERWDPGGGEEMHWAFPVTAGTPIEVRLYFANRYSGTAGVGQRVFDVTLDGTTVLNDYDIVADVGHDRGTMKAFTVTSDGTIDIDFGHVVENPLINAIEIVRTDITGPAPNADDLQHQYVASGGGTGLGALVGADIPWRDARGAVMIDGTVYYGRSDGTFVGRTFDGTTFGAAVAVDTSDQLSVLNDWRNEVRNVTGMTWAAGRLYFTLAGDGNVYYRYFTPSSRAIGAVRYTASGSVSGVDFSTVNGMILAGGKLYFGHSGDRALHRVDWSGTAPVAGTGAVVSGPEVDGLTWNNRAMWLYTGSNLQTPGPANHPPTASVQVQCTGLDCVADGSASADSDGTVTTYRWDFGDGSTAATATPSHSYASAGTYIVTLTVTDDDGATGTAITSVTVATGPAPATPISFVASASTAANGATANVGVPASVVAGDGLLLFVTNNSAASVATPAGWTLVGTRDLGAANGTTRLYSQVATAGSAGSTVSVVQSAAAKVAVTVAAYHGTDGTAPVASFASAAETTSRTAHTTPGGSVAADGAWVVSYWADKSSATTAWTAPAGESQRAATYGTGSGRITALLTDGGAVAAVGSAPASTATADAVSARATMWTVVLKQAVPVVSNVPPTAALSLQCTYLTCTASSAGSADPDGTITGYAWTFGDGATGGGASPSHSYDVAGTYTVTLTVTDDDGATGTASTSVTVTAPPGPTTPISHVGAASVNVNATAANVTVPAATTTGDTLLLFVSNASSTPAVSVPAGWNLVATRDFGASNGATRLYTRTATSTSAGSVVTVTQSATAKVVVTVAAYRGGHPTDPITVGSVAETASTTTHRTPGGTVATTGSWVVSYWADRSNATTAWTAPTEDTTRSSSFGTGSGRVSALLTDGGAPAPVGATPGKTASADSASARATMWTVILRPAG